jgi:two-component system, cell cycle response regulator
MASPARILVIEDNPANLKLMVYLLCAYGYRVESVRDGAAGLEKARAGSFDLVVCDVHLPKLDGFGVVQEMKRDDALRKTPVIAVTALAMVGDRDKILAAGFDGYLSKPIVPEKFVEQIEGFLSPPQLSKIRPVFRSGPGPGGEPIPLPRKDITILVVDDTPANLGFARSTLEPFGYTVLTTRSVKEALSMIAAKAPALILSDLHMPIISGRDFLRAAQTDPGLRGIPLLIISSTFSGSHERNECLALGATRFIQRPIEPEMLLANVESALEQRTRPAL